MFTEDYMDSYAMHRTSTGPGINSYVPHADLNLRAQKKFKGGKENMKKEGMFKSDKGTATDMVLGDVKSKIMKELQGGKTTTLKSIAKLVGQTVELESGRAGRVILKK
tara:strand:- start:1150 stop:1473 length:324 start_codon:yes stop_codon:yes gene_type:complete